MILVAGLHRALECLNVSRIAMATPYLDEVSQLEVDFFNKLGIEVTNWKGGVIVETADIQECPPEISTNAPKKWMMTGLKPYLYPAPGSGQLRTLQSSNKSSANR